MKLLIYFISHIIYFYSAMCIGGLIPINGKDSIFEKIIKEVERFFWGALLAIIVAISICYK